MADMPTVAFYTLGCKLNFAETSTIERKFVEKGFRKVDFDNPADVVVINTCTVTAAAEKKCRNIISRAVRKNSGTYIAVVGCYSQLSSDKIARIPGVDLVLGSEEKFRILDYAGDFQKSSSSAVFAEKISTSEEFSPSYSISGRTRSFLKIQDGCDYYCSYCTIPFARGRSRSASIDDILSQAARIASGGVKEVVLTGVNIGDFGKRGGESLYELLDKLSGVPGIERYRISSVEPDLLQEDIIRLIAGSNKFAPHFHLPLQSGCDRVLKMMNRKYTTDLFTERISMIRQSIPGAGIGADVITGFPGETETDFGETVRFLENADISYLHVFTYSDRENTRASRLPDKVSPGEKDNRSKVLHEVASRKHKDLLKRSAGEIHEVLFESINKKGRMQGFTGNYIRVEAPADAGAVNNITRVKLLGAGEDGMMKAIILK